MPPERRRMVSATSPDVHGDEAPDGLDARQRYRPRQTDVRVARADMGRATLPRRDPRRPRAASCTRTAWGAHGAIRLSAGRPSPRQRSLSHGSGISQDIGHLSHRERARRAGGRATGRAIRSCRASHLDRCRCRVPLRVVTRREPDRCRPGATFSGSDPATSDRSVLRITQARCHPASVSPLGHPSSKQLATFRVHTVAPRGSRCSRPGSRSRPRVTWQAHSYRPDARHLTRTRRHKPPRRRPRDARQAGTHPCPREIS